jgi:hypothetical protein
MRIVRNVTAAGNQEMVGVAVRIILRRTEAEGLRPDSDRGDAAAVGYASA